jgi:hypothetical protein
LATTFEEMLDQAIAVGQRALALAMASGEVTLYVLALTREHPGRSHQAYALRLLGDIAARHKPPERALAEAHHQQALVLAEELGMRPLLAHCHRGLGTFYLRIGR